MGLGPTICCRCEIFAVGKSNNEYHCPQCGRDDDLEYLWMFTEEQQERVHNNSKFFRFVLGEDVYQNDS